MSEITDINSKASSKRQNAKRAFFVAAFLSLGHFIAGVIFAVLERKFEVPFPSVPFLGFLSLCGGLLGVSIWEQKK